MPKAAILLLYFVLLAGSCAPDQADNTTGEQLAQIHCSSCHQYPEPELLDRNSWQNHILPRMGYLLGVLPLDSVGGAFFEADAYRNMARNPNILRTESVLSPADWVAIRDFYRDQAPETLPSAGSKPLSVGLSGFNVRIPDFRLSPPSSTLVQVDEKEPGFFIGDAHSRKIYRFDSQLQLQQIAETGEAPVSLHQIPEGTVVTAMGSFSPSDRSRGRTIFLPHTEGRRPLVLLDSLKRPAHLAIADLDGDSIQDYITSEFAKWTGALNWWKNDGYGQVQKRTLRNMPGAIRCEVLDINKDGKLDILALFGQGDEGIWAFYNQADGTFGDTCLLRFPPAYGSSYFSLVDYNGDAYPDLLYTNGDNADFPPILKPYHGIRIFVNKAWKKFEEVFFYPMPGAYKAIIRDFDQDGDQDIAAISFFPDFTNDAKAGFQYLVNQGDWQMQAFTFPEADKGRWITIDSGDIDRDGDEDLLLGSLAFEVIPASDLPRQWAESGIPFMVLENRFR